MQTMASSGNISGKYYHQKNADYNSRASQLQLSYAKNGSFTLYEGILCLTAEGFLTINCFSGLYRLFGVSQEQMLQEKSICDGE